MMKLTCSLFCMLLIVTCPISQARVARPDKVDLTREGHAQKLLVDEGALVQTYNLGPTGLRGWMYTVGANTGEAQQILVTKVDKGSPADGKVAPGDVILGIGETPFARDPRLALADAIGEAERTAQKGVLTLWMWRDAKTSPVDLPLKVMGSYSDTAPYNCPKSAKILEEGCDYITRHGNQWGRFELEGLVLLASGKKEYLPILKARAAEKAGSPQTLDFIKRVAESADPAGSAWNGGYGMFFWSEYYLSTGDKRILPLIEANAINTARGQGMWGTYGHGFSLRKSNGELHGMIPPYGALNQAGLGCFISMVLAQKAGVQHPEVNAAIARSNRFFSYYTGKGTIPYGEHRPEVWASHDNNGTSGLAAHAFALQGEHREDARFWGKMATAGYRSLEHGHAGPFFSYLWGTPGASIAGPEAAAAYFKEIRWHYELERRWDGSFAYTAGGGTHDQWGHDNRGISATGAYLLTYALPLRNLYLTGKDPDRKSWIDKTEVATAIQAGRFDHQEKSVSELLKTLGSWSPAERLTAAVELASRDGDILPRVMALAEGDDLNRTIGACHVMAHLGKRAEPALALLTRLLEHEDQWVRVQAGEALKTLGEAARPAVPAMLKAIAVTDERDPLRFGQGSLAYALFYPGGHVAGSPGLISKSIDNIDRELLYPAVKAVSIHPDGHARGCLRSTYELLTLEDVKALAPEVVISIIDMAPCNTMFSKGAMLAGIKMLGRLHIEEGLELTMQMYDWPYHGKGYVQKYAADVMKHYGGAARPLLPELKKRQAECLARNDVGGYERNTGIIAAIEGDESPAELVSIREQLSDAQMQNLRMIYTEIKTVTSDHAE